MIAWTLFVGFCEDMISFSVRQYYSRIGEFRDHHFPIDFLASIFGE